MIFLQSFIKDFSFKAFTNEEITIEQNSIITEEANNFKIYSIYAGDKLLDLDKMDIKGWKKADTQTGYPIQTNGYSEGNHIKFKPPLRLLFSDLTINFATSPVYSQGVVSYLTGKTTTMYANSTDNTSYVDITYPGLGSILFQAFIAILAIVFFQIFLNRMLSELILEKASFKKILFEAKNYIINFVVLALTVFGMYKIRENIPNPDVFSIFGVFYTFNDMIALLLMVFLTSLGIRSLYKNRKSDKRVAIVNWILFIINPFASFYILESAYNPEFMSMEVIYVLINAFILFLIQVLLYIVLRKKRLPMIFVLLVSIVFGIANDALFILRDSPLIPAFLSSLGVAADVAKETTITLGKTTLVAYVFACLWFLVISTIKDAKINISKMSYFKQLLAYASVFAIILVTSINYFVKQNGVGVNLWRPSRTYYVEGSPYSFYRILANQILTAPSGYDEKEVENTLENYYNKDVETKGNTKPNIIMIQSEALADYYGKGDLKLSENPIAFQRSLDENTIQGNAYVSVLGGGTVNSEYEALTSIPLTFFPSGAYPFQQYVKDGHTSIARILEDQGYDTFITHPNKPTNYSRQEVWPNLGFKNIAFLKEYDNAPDNFVPDKGFLKDSVAYDKIIDKYKNKKKDDKPLFYYLVTMQNHGGYHSNVEGNIKVENPNDGDDHGVNEYVNLVKESDKDLQKLVEFFKNYDEPTIICIFGDHQPQNYDAFMNLIKDGGKYTNEDVFFTPLTIWANYDIEEEKDLNISLNYVTPYLLQKAGGIKLSAYQKYMLDMRKDYPILTTKQVFDKNGQEVKDDSEFVERNKKLNSLIYYEMKQDTKSSKYFDEASK